MAEEKSKEYDVLIIGAGPSGLALANILARQGIRFAIIDKKEAPAKQSRAAIMHVRTLELLDTLGLAQPFVEQGLKIRDIKVYARGHRVAEFALVGKEAAALTSFPFALSIEQYKTEELLAEGLRAAGTNVAWGTELLALEGEQTRRAIVRSKDGKQETLSARWIVAADGAGSACRHALGLEFIGKTYELTGFLADVEIDPANKPEPGAIHLNLAHGGFVGLLGLSGGLYRLFGAVPPEFAQRTNDTKVSHEAYASIPLEAIQHWFDNYFSLKTKLVRAEWSSLFRIHSRLADRFRQDNVFLVGDAAHIHSPAGGQGMNLGIGDAFNLGWKLASVAKGEAPEQLLASYNQERRAVAKTVLHNTDRGFKLEANKNLVADWVKIHIMPSLLGPVMNRPAVQQILFKLFSQTWIRYNDSPIVGGQRTRLVAPGDRAPYGSFGQGSVYDTFKGGTHSLLVFDDPTAPPKNKVADALKAIAHASPVPIRVRLIPPAEHSLYRRYGVTDSCFFLVRPDSYVAYIGVPDHIDDFKTYMHTVFGKDQ